MNKPSKNMVLATDILDQASRHANMMRALFAAIGHRDDLGGVEARTDISYLIDLGKFATEQFTAVYDEQFYTAATAEREQETQLATITNHVYLIDSECSSTNYHVSPKDLGNYMAQLKNLVKDGGDD